MEKHDERGATPNQAHTEGRMGTGDNVGVRNTAGGGTQQAMPLRGGVGPSARSVGNDHDEPDVRVGAKGAMQLDVGEAIAMQSGNQVAAQVAVQDEDPPAHPARPGDAAD